MSTISKYRGNTIIFKNDKWIYKNTGLSVAENYKDISCGRCGRKSTEDGHDACLGVLIGVMNACCGHGEDKEAYIQFLDGKSIHGNDAITIIQILKKYS